jgi:FKBP-type peptidyl-prolyl cis-trans isomerase FkpA
MKNLLSALLALTIFISCSKDKSTTVDYTKDTTVDYTAINEKEITDYIAKNNLTATKTKSGLYYVINNPGTGAQPTASSKVTVAYKGYFTDGSIFDKNDAGFTCFLNQVIPGWTEGITYFKAGGDGVLLIPSKLGYGPYNSGPIPGGSVLVFDVKLISVN